MASKRVFVRQEADGSTTSYAYDVRLGELTVNNSRRGGLGSATKVSAAEKRNLVAQGVPVDALLRPC